MGKIVNEKSVKEMERMVKEEREKKERVVKGGERIGKRGNFLEKKIIEDVKRDEEIMKEEKLGKVEMLKRLDEMEEEMREENRMNYGMEDYELKGQQEKDERIQ